MKNKLVKLLWQEMIIFEKESLVQYFGRWKENACFFGNYVQVPQKVLLHCR
jgi:hypothetical protein